MIFKRNILSNAKIIFIAFGVMVFTALGVQSEESTTYSLQNGKIMYSHTMTCGKGPHVEKVFGNTQWLVIGCDDKHTMYVAAEKGNPAIKNNKPFFFILRWKDNAYETISNEPVDGIEARIATQKELRALSEKDIAKLAAQTQPQ